MEEKYLQFMESIAAKEGEKIFLWIIEFGSNLLYQLFIPAAVHDQEI